MEKTSGIYKIINIINNKIYIGSAVNLHNRRNSHFTYLKRRCHKNSHLQSSFDKYKEESFVFELIETCPKEKLIEREQYYIDTLNPEYNICRIAGNSLGTKRTKEQIDKMVKNRTKNNQYTYGAIMSEETKLKIGIKNKGKKPRLGLSLDKNARDKIGKANSKIIIYKNLITNEIIEFSSLKETAKYFNAYYQAISKTMKNKKPYKKYHLFSYK